MRRPRGMTSPAPSEPSVLHLETWGHRLRQVALALGHREVMVDGGTQTPATLRSAIDRVIDVTNPGHVWLTIAALSGQLPDDRTVTAVCRGAEFNGAATVLAEVAASTTELALSRPLKILTDSVVVDVQHTAHTDLATGIQRVARETAQRWYAKHNCVMVSWTEDFAALRLLTPAEHARMTGEPPPAGDPCAAPLTTIVVPWNCTYLVPELAADPPRTSRLLALARHSSNRTGVIGFDCVPITSADTSSTGFPGFFANYLAAVRHFDRITTISRAAATEYGGWRSMLEAVGLEGPDIQPILLPAQAPLLTEDAMRRARQRFIVADLPMVLCVGTHEPRKNHLAVLHAAEILWREGVHFSLTFIGGHSWNSARFRARLAALQAQGRPIETASGIDDDLLWGAYRLARCTVFPSFNEGFGLPAAESLAAGTPVVTSRYGSMREIALDGGALLVDPRDDTSITGAMRLILTDDRLHAELRAAALGRPSRTWDEYASETWDYLVD